MTSQIVSEASRQTVLIVTFVGRGYITHLNYKYTGLAASYTLSLRLYVPRADGPRVR